MHAYMHRVPLSCMVQAPQERGHPPPGDEPDLGAGGAAEAIDACAAALAKRFDARHGGFGGAPKFPRPSELSLLLVKALRDRAAGSDAPGARPRRVANAGVAYDRAAYALLSSVAWLYSYAVCLGSAHGDERADGC
jgi:hypothetical protein